MRTRENTKYTMEYLDKLSESKRRWLSIGITGIISGLLTVWGIYGIGEYGMALFILTPILLVLVQQFFTVIKEK